MAKKHSGKDVLAYHAHRDLYPQKHNLSFGSSKHSYSRGFCDGVNHPGPVATSRMRKSIKRNYGERSAKAYTLGVARGRKWGK